MAQYKVHKESCNEAPIKSGLQRQFNQDQELAVVKRLKLSVH
ncbi:hypothetical protein [Halobacillus seohaensis]